MINVMVDHINKPKSTCKKYEMLLIPKRLSHKVRSVEAVLISATSCEQHSEFHS